ncbi:hypothetical protein [Metabacillus sp. Hm71]|uniref:hypothetical protein n=1 Tax=Metabacillus sp. Hm71 TaxID=3450743 RepID=UPI003F435C0F
MFSAFVLLILFVLLLSGIWLLLGKLGLFNKIGNQTTNLKNIFEDKEEENK